MLNKINISSKERILIVYIVLAAVLTIITLYTMYSPTIKYFPLGSRFANAPVSFVTYLEKTFWPHDLAVFYPFSNQLPVWQVMGSVLLILVISVAVIAMMKRMPYLFVGWLWYAITLLPVIGIIQNGYYAMADRYTYLPSIGIAVMLAWGIPFMFSSEDMRKKILFPAGIAALAILAVLAWQQCSFWKNSITLFSHALQVTKDNYLAHNNFANALVNEGKIVEAIDHFNKAIIIKPDYADAYSNRGVAYHKLGQYQRAIEDYNQNIRLKPDNDLAYYSRGLAYIELGQYQLAIDDFNKAIRLNPNYARAYNNRGISYNKLGQYQLAIDDFNKAISLIPNYTRAYNKRSNAYFNQGNKERSCRDLQKACELGECKLLEWTKGNGYCR